MSYFETVGLFNLLDRAYNADDHHETYSNIQQLYESGAIRDEDNLFHEGDVYETHRSVALKIREFLL